MLCVYSYMTRSYSLHGNFQCDTEDFKAFFRKCQSKILVCYVKLENGENWMYGDGFGWEPMTPSAVRYEWVSDKIDVDDYMENFDLF